MNEMSIPICIACDNELYEPGPWHSPTCEERHLCECGATGEGFPDEPGPWHGRGCRLYSQAETLNEMVLGGINSPEDGVRLFFEVIA